MNIMEESFEISIGRFPQPTTITTMFGTNVINGTFLLLLNSHWQRQNCHRKQAHSHKHLQVIGGIQ